MIVPCNVPPHIACPGDCELACADEATRAPPTIMTCVAGFERAVGSVVFCDIPGGCFNNNSPFALSPPPVPPTAPTPPPSKSTYFFAQGGMPVRRKAGDCVVKFCESGVSTCRAGDSGDDLHKGVVPAGGAAANAACCCP